MDHPSNSMYVHPTSHTSMIKRKEKDWKKSDELRDKIKELGWIIKDVGDGFELEKDE